MAEIPQNPHCCGNKSAFKSGHSALCLYMYLP